MGFMSRKPIGHLSDRNIQKKRREAMILWILAGAVVLYAVFNFFGRNFTYSMLVKGAMKNMDKGKLTLAISDLNKAMNMNPDGPLAIDGLGSVYLRQGESEKALKYFMDAISADIKYNKTVDHVKYGNYFLDQGIYDRAKMEFEQAARINDTSFEAFYGIGCCFHASMDLDNAIKYYNKSLSYNSKFVKARKGLSLAQDDRNKGAIYYMFDRNGEPLVRYNLIPGQDKKTYVMDQKAAHLTGYERIKDQTKEGLEKYLASYIPGNKVYLTIDTQVQDVISKYMGSYKGSIVVLNPKTGEVLGMYSQPTFRPSAIQNGEYYLDRKWDANRPLLNRATDKLYEPGSIAKLITLAAAYEYGINEPDIFPVKCSAYASYDGTPFLCWAKHKSVKSIEEALETSCNIAAAQIGFAVGGPRLVEFSNKFGFDQPLDLGFRDPITKNFVSIPALTSKAPINHRNKYEIAMHACGLTPDQRRMPYMITPVHAAMMAAAIANGGTMMKPYLVKEIRNVTGKLIYEAQPKEFKNTMSPLTAKKLTELMVSDVESPKGTGKKARVLGLKVAGKTGTSGGGGILNAWFITFAPADDPKYAIAILGDGEGKGMTVAAPIAADIYKALIK